MLAFYAGAQVFPNLTFGWVDVIVKHMKFLRLVEDIAWLGELHTIMKL
jgi:hypothetical protein